MPVDPKKISARKRTHFKDGKIDGQDLKNLVEAGFTWLKTNQQTVNALNVFPAFRKRKNQVRETGTPDFRRNKRGN